MEVITHLLTDFKQKEISMTYCWRRLLQWFFPYCWNKAWQESASKPFHVDASFETLVFKIIQADREPIAASLNCTAHFVTQKRGYPIQTSENQQDIVIQCNLLVDLYEN